MFGYSGCFVVAWLLIQALTKAKESGQWHIVRLFMMFEYSGCFVAAWLLIQVLTNSQSVWAVAHSSTFHDKTKFIEVRYHFS